MHAGDSQIEKQYRDFISAESFPCIAAKVAVKKSNIQVMVAGHMGCPMHDKHIHEFLGKFVFDFRNSNEIYHSAAVIFRYPVSGEDEFENLLWQRLQSLSDIDALQNEYDTSVNRDPFADNFSFSLHGEGLFIIGMHPYNERPARRFSYPALIFNPHKSFEELRSKGGYNKMKSLVRQHDLEMNGSVNPMLADFGERSETFQYSGKKYDSSWQCPLQINHGKEQN